MNPVRGTALSAPDSSGLISFRSLNRSGIRLGFYASHVDVKNKDNPGQSFSHREDELAGFINTIVSGSIKIALMSAVIEVARCVWSVTKLDP